MAKFVTVVRDGAFTVELDGKPGEELTSEQTIAYAQMHAAYNLGRIAEKLDDIGADLSHIAEILETK